MKAKKLLITTMLVDTIPITPATAMSSKVKPPVAESYVGWTQSFINFFSF